MTFDTDRFAGQIRIIHSRLGQLLRRHRSRGRDAAVLRILQPFGDAIFGIFRQSARRSFLVFLLVLAAATTSGRPFGLRRGIGTGRGDAPVRYG